jgi:hypothetical protein
MVEKWPPSPIANLVVNLIKIQNYVVEIFGGLLPPPLNFDMLFGLPSQLTIK